MDPSLKELIDQWLQQDPVSSSWLQRVSWSTLIVSQNEETRQEIEDLVKNSSIAELEKRMRYGTMLRTVPLILIRPNCRPRIEFGTAGISKHLTRESEC